MKIAFAIDTLEEHGSVRRVVDFANELVKNGNRVTIYSSPKKKKKFFGFISVKDENAEIECEWLKCDARVTDIKTLKNTHYNADVLILCTNNPDYFKIAQEYYAIIKIYYFLSLGDHTNLDRLVKQVQEPGNEDVFKQIITDDRWRIAVCNGWMLPFIHNNFRPNDVALIYSGVNTDIFYPSKNIMYPQKDKKVYILSSGDPRKREGMDAVYRAIDILKRDGYNIELRTYHGKGLSQQEIGDLYRTSHIILNGQHYGGWCNIVMEAAACRKPIVTVDSPHATSQFPISPPCFLKVERDDNEAMARSCAYLIDNPSIAMTIANNAYERSKDFRWEYTYKNFVDTLKYWEGKYNYFGYLEWCDEMFPGLNLDKENIEEFVARIDDEFKPFKDSLFEFVKELSLNISRLVEEYPELKRYLDDDDG